ncbi:hypothetical protein HMPREF0372_02703 [Flavonifractor plautii ATCC 29863]|uniref:Lipoprotein n=1 Tax=Flavonifractor plautii ATCC 29863 TaxID=411475 RepID=G9YT43_FLAPL|nr:hypothetical protein HMPREF0372_02703 [Flavonifractor plautii ATCC 29863]
MRLLAGSRSVLFPIVGGASCKYDENEKEKQPTYSRRFYK